eukprot:4112417-Lingulodinium_polyedra.AAC.1
MDRASRLPLHLARFPGAASMQRYPACEAPPAALWRATPTNCKRRASPAGIGNAVKETSEAWTAMPAN